MAEYGWVYGFGYLRVTAEDWDQLQTTTLASSMGYVTINFRGESRTPAKKYESAIYTVASEPAMIFANLIL